MKDQKKGLIFILSGPSGVGKGTIRSMLDLDKLNMINSVSLTTRDPRPEDIDGVTYRFVTPEEFQKTVDEGKFIEHAGYDRRAYGTLREPIEQTVNAGRNILLEIEVNGAHTVMTKKPEAVTIFLAPPEIDTLRKRLTERNDLPPETIERRVKRAEEEMRFKDDYDYVVVNDDLNTAAAQVQKIMEEEVRKHLES